MVKNVKQAKKELPLEEMKMPSPEPTMKPAPEPAKKPAVEPMPQENEKVFDFKMSDLSPDNQTNFVNGDRVTITLSGTIVSTEQGNVSLKADDISAVKVEPENEMAEEELAKEPLSITKALNKAKEYDIRRTKKRT